MSNVIDDNNNEEEEEEDEELIKGKSGKKRLSSSYWMLLETFKNVLNKCLLNNIDKYYNVRIDITNTKDGVDLVNILRLLLLSLFNDNNNNIEKLRSSSNIRSRMLLVTNSGGGGIDLPMPLKYIFHNDDEFIIYILLITSSSTSTPPPKMGDSNNNNTVVDDDGGGVDYGGFLVNIIRNILIINRTRYNNEHDDNNNTMINMKLKALQTAIDLTFKNNKVRGKILIDVTSIYINNRILHITMVLRELMMRWSMMRSRKGGYNVNEYYNNNTSSSSSSSSLWYMKMMLPEDITLYNNKASGINIEDRGDDDDDYGDYINECYNNYIINICKILINGSDDDYEKDEVDNINDDSSLMINDEVDSCYYNDDNVFGGGGVGMDNNEVIGTSTTTISSLYNNNDVDIILQEGGGSDDDYNKIDINSPITTTSNDEYYNNIIIVQSPTTLWKIYCDYTITDYKSILNDNITLLKQQQEEDDEDDDDNRQVYQEVVVDGGGHDDDIHDNNNNSLVALWNNIKDDDEGGGGELVGSEGGGDNNSNMEDDDVSYYNTTSIITSTSTSAVEVGPVKVNNNNGYYNNNYYYGVVLRWSLDVPKRDTKASLLIKQNGKCPGCGDNLPDTLLNQPRYCNYTGMLFCHKCHINDGRVIPGKAIKENDYLEYKVSIVAAEFLDSQSLLPLLTIGCEVFPKHNTLLYKIHIMRLCLHKIRDMPLCTAYNIAQFNIDTTQQLPSHIMNNTISYSLRDLIDINKSAAAAGAGAGGAGGGGTGCCKLGYVMGNIINKWVIHVWSCNECINNHSGLCNICNSLIPIFPFNIRHYYRCYNCNTIYHKQCLQRSNNQCPKCSTTIPEPPPPPAPAATGVGYY